MEKLILILFLFLVGFQVSASEFVLLGEIRWPTTEKIQKTRFGGISGITFQSNKVFFVSDDRGQLNEPRFYEFQIKKDKNIWKLEGGKVHFLGLPPDASRRQILDLEAIAALPSGNFIISSEGDNNKKPRVPPRIFEVSLDGKWVRDILMPARAVPEATGQQKIGIGNNFGFESMAVSDQAQNLYFISERPLIQDIDVKDTFNQFRFYQMKQKQDHFEISGERLVHGPPPSTEAGVALVQGFSEMIVKDEQKFLLLDRTLKINSSRLLTFECRLIELDVAKASDTSKIEKLTEAQKLQAAQISHVHSLKSGASELGNCEGMAFGPGNDEYKQTLWIITDNNFSKSVDTVLYFYGVKN